MAIYIHTFELEATPPQLKVYTELLSPDEVNRAERFYFAGDRPRFIISRANLRLILASYLHTQPHSLQFSYGARGKPSLDRHPLHFNLSHTAKLAICAVSFSDEIGIDMEYLEPRSHTQQIARRFFHTHELEIFYQSNSDLAVFYKIWTAKEAYLKGTGLGLGKLSTVATCWVGGKIMGLEVNHKPTNWIINDLDLPCGYIGTLVSSSTYNYHA